MHSIYRFRRKDFQMVMRLYNMLRIQECNLIQELVRKMHYFSIWNFCLFNAPNNVQVLLLYVGMDIQVKHFKNLRYTYIFLIFVLVGFPCSQLFCCFFIPKFCVWILVYFISKPKYRMFIYCVLVSFSFLTKYIFVTCNKLKYINKCLIVCLIYFH